jgi:hypothetical protein
MHPYAAFATWFLIAFINGYIAKRKNRSVILWSFLGLFIGILGWLILWRVKPKGSEKSTSSLSQYLESALQMPSPESKDEKAEISSDNL